VFRLSSALNSRFVSMNQSLTFGFTRHSTVHQMSIKPAPIPLRQNGDFPKSFNVICPVQSPRGKNSSCSVGQIKTISLAVSSQREGRWPSSRTLGRDAVDAAASGARRDRRVGRKACERSTGAQTNDAKAYGKTVWSWHPLLVSSRRRFSRAQPGATKPSIRR
jgi:hypothetical protein